MEIVDKRKLITAIDKSTEDLHQRIDMQRHLMTTILEQRVGDGMMRADLKRPSGRPSKSWKKAGRPLNPKDWRPSGRSSQKH